MRPGDNLLYEERRKEPSREQSMKGACLQEGICGFAGLAKL